jgi:hypothetical protein
MYNSVIFNPVIMPGRFDKHDGALLATCVSSWMAEKREHKTEAAIWSG